VSIRCMMSMPYAGRQAWFKGVLTIDSLHHTLEFTRGSSSVSALHARVGPVKIHFGDDDSIGFKCISTKKGEEGAARDFDVQINFSSSSVTFRCDNALDAAHVEASLLSILLFRTMVAHHDQRPISSLGSESSSAPDNGAHYLRTRLRLLRKIRLFEAFKASLGPSTAGSPQASQAGSLHRKLDSRATILVSWAHEMSHFTCHIVDCTHTDTHRHTQTHRHTHTDTQTHTHTHTHTDTHTHTQTHRHTHTHTHTQLLQLICPALTNSSSRTLQFDLLRKAWWAASRRLRHHDEHADNHRYKILQARSCAARACVAGGWFG
jgi:hypothetical protein